MNNLDTLIENLEILSTNLKNTDNKSFMLEEIMTDRFIKLHTNFVSFSDFLDNSPFEINTYEDIEANIVIFNTFISSVSKFENWEAMIEEALLDLIDFIE